MKSPERLPEAALAGLAPSLLLPRITAAEHEVWREYIRRQAHLDFPASRLRYLQQRLWSRMEATGLTTYMAYYHHVAFSPQGPAEWRRLVDLLVNNESSFFRHPGSFQALSQHALPQLVALRDAEGVDRSLRAWSAGCSAGQEAYSLAMAYLQLGLAAPWRGEIVATDIGGQILARAAQGRFKPHDLRSLPELWRRRYFVPVERDFLIADEVRQLVRFEYANLADPTTYPSGEHDVIFCQNVLIYFSRADREAVVGRLARRLRPGGYLFLGPAEFVSTRLPGMTLLRLPGTLVYQRNH